MIKSDDKPRPRQKEEEESVIPLLFKNKKTIFDPVTGALLRDSFLFLFEMEGKLATRHSYYVSLLDLEIDQKGVDRKIPNIFKQVRKNLRGSDLVGRKDIQRFNIVLPYVDTSGARRISERLRKRLFLGDPNGGDEPLELTLSIGGACFPLQTTDPFRLFNIAEEMLDVAKERGGNKVCIL